MKKAKLALVSTGLLLAFGCADQNPANQTIDEPTLPFSIAKSASVHRATDPIDNLLIAQQAQSINDFSIDMYKQLISQEKGNVFFSPYSITTALGMATAGASGQTETQMRDALRAKLSGNDFHAAINGLDNNLTSYANQTEGITLNIVNSSWMQSGWNFRAAYLDILTRYYGAGVNLLDFSNNPEESRTVINNWVADQTNDKIIDLIPQDIITSNTVLVLTNAIHFLGNWLYKFDKTKTQEKSFHLLDNTVATVPLMKLGEDNKTVEMMYAYDQINRVKAINFPYKGDRLCMTVILPDSGAFTEYESSLTFQKIDILLDLLKNTELPPVYLPRFSYGSSSLSLKNAFKNLGMIDAFTDDADFSGIDGTKDLYIADIIHKAFIAVDETGTEAAAATAVVFEEKSGYPAYFTANRPFIYIIRDKQTNVILFMGRTVNPNQKQ